MDLERLKNGIREGVAITARLLEDFIDASLDDLGRLALATEKSLNAGGKVLVFGNGGSAADAQHLAGELVGRFAMERRPFAAIALTADTSIITCVGNDYGFDEVFARQVRGLSRPGDVVIGISTSGKSPNVVNALTAAKELGCVTVALIGEARQALAPVSDYVFSVPSTHTPRIQECHGVWVHAYCLLVEELLAKGGPECP